MLQLTVILHIKFKAFYRNANAILPNRVNSGRQQDILCLTDYVFKYCIEELNQFSIDDNGDCETTMITNTTVNSKPK